MCRSYPPPASLDAVVNGVNRSLQWPVRNAPKGGTLLSQGAITPKPWEDSPRGGLRCSR
jgi:hypothetical protein